MTDDEPIKIVAAAFAYPREWDSVCKFSPSVALHCERQARAALTALREAGYEVRRK